MGDLSLQQKENRGSEYVYSKERLSQILREHYRTIPIIIIDEYVAKNFKYCITFSGKKCEL